MDLAAKIRSLQTQENLALYKWTAGGTRVVGGAYILLSDLRLNSLVVHGGRALLSVAAPLLYMSHGRPKIALETSNVVTVVSGKRKGINTKLEWLQPSEKAVATKACLTCVLDPDAEYPTWLQKRILSLGCSARYPSAKILAPDLYRMSRSLDSFRPLWSKALVEAIGGTPDEPLESLMEKFKAAMQVLGIVTGEGYVIPADYIATGGCCIALAKGITARSGSVVHMMPCTMFLAEVCQNNWHLFGETP